MRRDPPDTARSQDRYREDLKQAVAYWTDCYESGSNGGFCKCAPPSPRLHAPAELSCALDICKLAQLLSNAVPWCRRTRDGYLYPVDVPWGNMGTSLGGVCMAAIYNVLPGGSTPEKSRARCFMQAQLSYITNHKCSRGDANSYKCHTPSAEGFSYIVGYALPSLFAPDLQRALCPCLRAVLHWLRAHLYM